MEFVTASMSPDEVSRLLGPIKTEKLRSQRYRSHHGPRFVVQTPKFSGFDYSRLSRIRIIDFGQAFHANQPPRPLGVPRSYFPPELCFGYLPSAKSDVWQLACILYETHTDHYRFPTFFEIFEILIGTAVGLFGPIPQHWRGNYNFDEYGYAEPGEERATREPEWWFGVIYPEEKVNELLTEYAAHLSDHQREELVALLRDMVAYEPGQRASLLRM